MTSSRRTRSPPLENPASRRTRSPPMENPAARGEDPAPAPAPLAAYLTASGTASLLIPSGRVSNLISDMYSSQMGGFPAPAARASAIETGTKLRISKLDYGVSNEDIKEGAPQDGQDVVAVEGGGAVVNVKAAMSQYLLRSLMLIEISYPDLGPPVACSMLLNSFLYFCCSVWKENHS